MIGGDRRHRLVLRLAGVVHREAHGSGTVGHDDVGIGRGAGTGPGGTGGSGAGVGGGIGIGGLGSGGRSGPGSGGGIGVARGSIAAVDCEERVIVGRATPVLAC